VLGAGAVLHDRPFLEQTLGEAGAARTLPSIFFCIGKKKVAGTAGRGSCGVCVCVCVCVVPLRRFNQPVHSDPRPSVRAPECSGTRAQCARRIHSPARPASALGMRQASSALA